MARRPTTSKPQSGAHALSKADEPTKPAPLAEGRGHQLPAASAAAIAAASQKSGFPVPPHVQAALDAGATTDRAASAAETPEA